jgi:flagellar biosynthesis anti-sigma factor FlgM
MTMRINGQPPPPVDTEAARRLESAKAAERSSGTGHAPKAGDRVEVSTDAQLISTAVQAAKDSPDVRADAVERGRRALENGTLGNDPDRLAKRIVDALLGE